VGELGEPISTVIGEIPGERLGFRLASVPAEPRSGLAISAPNASTIVPNGGTVTVYGDLSSAEELTPDDAQLTITTPNPGSYLGQALTACPRPGGASLIVGAPGPVSGSIHRFNLPASGTRSAESAALNIYASPAISQLGGALSCSPDGEWFAAGASYTNTTHTQAGVAFLFETGLAGAHNDSAAVAKIEGDALGQHLGGTVSMGDVNGDGMVDMLVGGGGEGAHEPFASTAAVFLGPLMGTHSVADADVRWNGLEPIDLLGHQVASGGDMNGDGHQDLAIAAYWDSATAERSGAVYILLGGPTGPGALADAEAIIRGTHDYSYAGISIAWVADASGDGLSDLAVGEYGRGSGGDPEAIAVGAAHLFLGPLSGTLATGEATLTLEGESSSSAFGYWVTGLDDVDGDGLSDLAVGAFQTEAERGQVFLFSGGRP
jgi:hypothetical protein